MKVAISAGGAVLSSAVDPRFARAPWFIIADTDTDEWKAVDNTQNVQAAQGAGIQAAQCVVREGAQIVLTGHCGPNAFHALGAAHVKVIVGVEGTVGEALERLKKGELKPSDAPDVQGHWV